MGRFFKGFTSMILAFLLLFCTAFAKYEYIFDKIVSESEGKVFLNKVYESSPDISQEEINGYFYVFIDNVMNKVAESASNNNNKISKDEVFSIAANELKTTSFDLGLCLGFAYPEAIASGQLPPQFNVLANVVKQEATTALEITLTDDEYVPSNPGSSGSGITVPKDDNTTKDEPKANPQFGDLNNFAWAQEAINELYKADVVAGISETSFSPDSNVTREQFAKLCAVAFDLTTTGATCNFNDVAADSWYYPYVASLSGKGIIKGSSADTFGTGEYITRQDMAVILDRIFVQKGLSAESIGENDKFSDDDNIMDYAKFAVYNMRSRGIISGMGDNMFMPGSYANRAQAAMMIYKMYKLKK